MAFNFFLLGFWVVVVVVVVLGLRVASVVVVLSLQRINSLCLRKWPTIEASKGGVNELEKIVSLQNLAIFTTEKAKNHPELLPLVSVYIY